VLIFVAWALRPQVDKPLKSVTHDQCDARPTVTFPAAGHRFPAAGIKLYCSVSDRGTHMCVINLPKVHLAVELPGVNM